MSLVKCKECDEEISKKAPSCPKCGAPAKKRTSLFTWIVTIILGLWLYGYLSGISNTNTSQSNTPAAVDAKESAAKDVKLEYSWKKEGFDNVMMANFTIKNNSNAQIKDIEITCTHFAKSGTRIDSNARTIYDVVPAKSKKLFADFNMGFIHSQAESSACSITNYKT